MAQQQISRREMLRRSGAVGAGALVLGGAGGFLVGNATSDGGGDGGGGGGGGGGREIRAVGIFPLSGAVAADGQEMRNGVVMAIDEINAAGGLFGSRIRYIEIDDQDSSTDQITTAFRRAVDVENPDVIFSGYHLATGPEFDIVADAGRLYYNVNTQQAWVDRYSGDREKYWSIFQCDPTETWYGGGFALWADDAVNTGLFPTREKTAVILAGDDPYDSYIAQSYEAKATELGWRILAKDSFTVGNVSDWGPLLNRARQTRPTVLFTTDFSPADDAAMMQNWSSNATPTIMYQQYGPSVPEFLDLAGPAANGVIWGTVLGLLPDAIGNDFRQRYQAKFDAQPGWANAGGCYDEVFVWAQGVQDAGAFTDYRKVAEATEKVVRRGTTGSTSFIEHAGVQYPHQTQDASLGQPHILVQIQNGEHKVVFPEPFTSGTFELPTWFR
jgi:branched-chain amino acid transport system substrate-binding protein